MAKLSIEDLINKREDWEKRKEKKYIDIHSEFLGGEIEFHSVEKDDILDFRDRAKSDPRKAVLHFIYISSDDLRNKELLKAYGRDKREQYKIVEDLFGTEAEQEKVLEILLKLNGLDGISPEQIYIKEVEEIKN
jgi:hypothetical protein